MALNTRVSLAAWTAMMTALGVKLNSGYIQIYTGTQPATPDTALSANTLLVTLTFSATAWASVTLGVATANAITGGTAVANGTATWFRCYASDDATAHLDGTCGTSGTDMIVSNATIATGAPVTCSSMTCQYPTGQ